MITTPESGVITSTGLPTFPDRNFSSESRSAIIWSGFLSAFNAITIFYIVKATHDQRALVYPFYTIPGES